MRLTPGQKVRLDTAARQRKTSMAKVVRDLIDGLELAPPDDRTERFLLVIHNQLEAILRHLVHQTRTTPEDLALARVLVELADQLNHAPGSSPTADQASPST